MTFLTKLSRNMWSALTALTLSAFFATTATAQDTRRYYGDTARVSAMNYVISPDEAFKLSRETGKPIFVNCYAKWAGPCVGMDQFVFSNKEYAAYMDKKFVCLFVDMQSDEGKSIAQKYNVNAYACYLVLDADGNLIHRIQGGTRLPEFREWTDMALSPKTSLAGTRKKYESGKASRKETYAYLKALRIGGIDSTFRTVGREYAKDIPMNEMHKQENWMFGKLFSDRNGEYFNYLLNNKALFVAENGLRAVNNRFESFLTPELLAQASGDTPYDSAAVARCRKELAQFEMADTCACHILCGIAELRGKQQYDDLIHFMDSAAHYLDKYYGIRANIELTFNFPNATEKERQNVIAYLKRAAERENGRQTGSRLSGFVAQLEAEGHGIEFITGSFEDAKQKAKEEGKRIFMDCYTTWCGPCRYMSSNIFTRSDVGEFFNKHYVSIKIDMEKGEGIELAKRYNVKAFPTMLFMDAEGNVVVEKVGSCGAEELNKLAEEALQ